MSIGAQLRASREAKGLTLDAVASTIRVQPRILAAIERDDVRAVPPRPFGRGFVKAYAEEIGLDADQVARDYFAQFAPTPTPSSPEPAVPVEPLTERSGGWIPVVAVAGLLAGLALAFVARRPARAPITPVAAAAVAAETPEPAAAPSAGQSVPAAAPAAEAPAAAPVPAAPLTIVLTASRPSWVSATADGRRALYQAVTPGSPQTLIAAREIVIRVGDAGALAWRINGREVGAMGSSGQVRDIRVTPAAAATMR